MRRGRLGSGGFCTILEDPGWPFLRGFASYGYYGYRSDGIKPATRRCMTLAGFDDTIQKDTNRKEETRYDDTDAGYDDTGVGR